MISCTADFLIQKQATEIVVLQKQLTFVYVLCYTCGKSTFGQGTASSRIIRCCMQLSQPKHVPLLFVDPLKQFNFFLTDIKKKQVALDSTVFLCVCQATLSSFVNRFQKFSFCQNMEYIYLNLKKNYLKGVKLEENPVLFNFNHFPLTD